jgi:hypothetical protein
MSALPLMREDGFFRGDDVPLRTGGKAWCAEHHRGLQHLEACEKGRSLERELWHTISIHHKRSRAGQAHDAVERAPSHIAERPHVCNLNPEMLSGIAIVLAAIEEAEMLGRIAIALAATKEVLIPSFPSEGKALFIIFTSI